MCGEWHEEISWTIIRYVILSSLNQDSKSSLNHHNTEVGPDEYAIIVSGFAPYVAFDCEVFSRMFENGF